MPLALWLGEGAPLLISSYKGSSFLESSFNLDYFTQFGQIWSKKQ